jgi:hypothetical protein
LLSCHRTSHRRLGTSRDVTDGYAQKLDAKFIQSILAHSTIDCTMPSSMDGFAGDSITNYRSGWI